MIKYVVTGGTGWLGQTLLASLSSGKGSDEALISLADDEKIRCLCLKKELTTAPKLDKVEWVAGDISSGDGLHKLFHQTEGAILLHMAGLIHPKLFVSDFDRVNYRGTKNLMKHAKAARISKAVVMSSNSPIGCNPDADHVFTEESPFNPYMGYGFSKYKMELFLREAIDSGDFFPISIIRAPWFYGPNQPARQKLFFDMIRKGKGPLVGDGSNKRSMAYVENLTQGILLCAHRPEADNEVFWIADKRQYTMGEILDTIERLMRENFGIECHGGRLRLPSLTGDIAFAADKALQSVGLYNQKIHVLSEMNKTISCSIEKAERLLGYNPKVSLEQGMNNSLNEFFGEK